MRNDTARWLSPGDAATITTSLTTRFHQEFGREPEGVWFAPGRANLNGEHIDFHGGRCLPMALKHGTYVAAAPRTDGLLRLRTLDPELDCGVVEIPVSAVQPRKDDDDGDQLPSWTRYVSGVVWALQRLEDEHEELRLASGFGADLIIRSTLPIGAGLSSSASLECASALACVAVGSPLGEEHPGEELTTALSDEQRAVLADACIRAEVEVVGAGTGGLDQTTSLRGKKNRLLSLDCRDFTLKRIDVTFLLRCYSLIAVDTGQSHRLADSAFGERRADSEAAAQALGVDSLRDAVPERPRRADVDEALAEFDEQTRGEGQVHGRSTQDCRRRLKHALSEIVRSEKIHLMLTGDAHGVDHTAETIGDVMTAGHTSMRENAEVSFELADRVVDAALTAGAVGARLIGGGFGGSVLVLAPKGSVDTVTASLASLSPQIRFLDVTPSASAHAVSAL